MPTSRLNKTQVMQAFAAYAVRANNYTPAECEDLEARFPYTPRQEPEEM